MHFYGFLGNKIIQYDEFNPNELPNTVNSHNATSSTASAIPDEEFLLTTPSNALTSTTPVLVKEDEDDDLLTIPI